MKNSAAEKTASNKASLSGSRFIPAIITVLVLAATFLVANSNQPLQIKAAIFVVLVSANLLIWIGSSLKQQRQINDLPPRADASEAICRADIENKLLALEEASEFFGASLKPADMFRLISSRVNEIIPSAVIALYLTAENGAKFKIACAAGANAPFLVNLELNTDKGLAGKTFVSRKPQIDENLIFDKSVLPSEALKNLNSSVAVPLWRKSDVFGVLQLFGEREKQFDENSLKLLEAVAERIAPLFLSSQAFEKSLSNALTDSLTNLPNERAFFMVLENQIAHSQREPNERPLSILSVDVKNFAELNRKFGHATGDRILSFAADVIKNQLRQMDFAARAASDEFLVVLPTASDEITAEIVRRLEREFLRKSFEIAETEKIFLQLNFGSATFLQDGETATELLRSARRRKREAKLGKSEQNNKILRFPKELVN